MRPIIGDFFLTRNAEGPGEWGNPSPGHWNHVAVCVASDWIIEAQVEPHNRVIASDWYEFYNRYPEIVILRPPVQYAVPIAYRAKTLFGRPYRRIAISLARREKVGENCVTIARKSWLYASGTDLKWRIPDHLLGSAVTGYLSVVGSKPAGLIPAFS